MQRKPQKPQQTGHTPVAGNGLLDRRAFLRGGAAVAATITGYTVAKSAAAEPLKDDPWSLVPGAGCDHQTLRTTFALRRKSRAYADQP